MIYVKKKQKTNQLVSFVIFISIHDFGVLQEKILKNLFSSLPLSLQIESN